jgi:hypothetical protein
MDDEILIEIKSKILNEIKSKILNEIKSKILNAQTIDELQVYISKLQDRIHLLKSQVKSNPPDTSQVFNNHFC